MMVPELSALGGTDGAPATGSAIRPAVEVAPALHRPRVRRAGR